MSTKINPILLDPTGAANGAALVYNSANGVAWGAPAAGGVTSYETLAELPLSGNSSGDMAYVEENNRLYLWTGVGWFNIALINTNPSITSGPSAGYALAKDGTPTVITLVASDPEGIPITWSYQVTSGTLGDTAVITQDGNEFTITPSTNTEHVGTFGVTFTASDGVNIATAASVFTLVFSASDTRYNQSIVLTTSNTNNANNNTFIDSSTNNFTVTRNGNATQGTFSPFSPAGWSGYFDGTGDYLSVADNAALDFGTGDFTIEMWVYVQNTTGSGLVEKRSAGANPWLWYLTGTNLYPEFYTGTSYTSNISVPLNQWTHVAVTRSSGTLRQFVNGVSAFSGSMTTNLDNTNPMLLMASVDASAYLGYSSNIRIVKGTAIYTENFTPPTEPLTAVAGTSLLTLQDNRFKDNSTNNFAITRAGDTRITPFSPFIPTVEYLPSIHGGSAYFDGTGDFLDIPSSTAFGYGTGDFTIEFWAYLTSISASTPNLIDQRAGVSSQVVPTLYLSNGGLNYYVNGTNLWAGPTLKPNQWYHLAICRSSGSTRIFVDGVQQGSTLSDNNNYITSPVRVFASRDASAAVAQAGYCSNLRILKGTALYTSNFTPPTAPVTAVSGTSLLLNFTNSNIFDETGKVVVETVGDAKVSTSVVKYGDSSIILTPGGGSHYTKAPLTENFKFYAGENFTIECWIYLITNAAGICAVWSNYTSFTTGSLSLFAGHNGSNSNLFIIAHNGTFPALSSTTTVNSRIGLWTHLAVVRNNDQIRLYINGVSEGGALSSTVGLTGVGSSFWVGTTGDSPSGNPNCHISDFRVTKGHARYTTNFTPPTAKLGFSNEE